MPRLQEETLTKIRNDIEDAAQRLFVRKGFAATTTREIADEIGFSAGAIYNHFDSKETLFASVVSRYQEVLRAEENALKRALRATRFPFDIPELARAIKDVVEHHRAFWLLWYVDVLEFQAKHFQAQLVPRALLDLPELSRRFEELRREKVLSIDPELAFVMVYMHLFNFFIVEKIFGGVNHYGVSEDVAVQAIADAFLRGILA